MPHLIDRETGLCSVCQRLQIAAIKEGKKFKRQTYDVRKLAIDNLTSKSDPNYKAIIDRHYVKYKDSFDEYKSAHRKSSIEYGLRPTFTKKISFDNSLAYDELSDDDDDSDFDLRSRQASRLRNKHDYREVLRKVNLAQASRLNDRSGNNSSPFATNRKSNNSRASMKNNSRLSDANDHGDYLTLIPSPNKYSYRKKFNQESPQNNGEKKIYYSSYFFEESPGVYEPLPSIYKDH
ncbi:hypothetical protein BpHYR1_048026 [Brachionus plicatilis]|uniref:Uncharacterized protein n=1 Tax=Brachionus plicatilis TaxID=10195 RepID=A0A3M7T9I4_BRAPC|nr:hypothetical protein BpHYR1_048026 [Brachionus plicatilis]